MHAVSNHRNTPQHTATHCNAQQHPATPCNTRNTLQHPAATPCNALQHTVTQEQHACRFKSLLRQLNSFRSRSGTTKRGFDLNKNSFQEFVKVLRNTHKNASSSQRMFGVSRSMFHPAATRHNMLPHTATHCNKTGGAPRMELVET